MDKPKLPPAFDGLDLARGLAFDRTLTSSVTTGWGVQWDEVYIARDLLQNFFDANRDRLDEVAITAAGRDVTVTAPTPFHLDRLFYFGSEKGDEDVGHYGEGFKVAAACLLRDHDVTVLAQSGHQVLLLRISEQAVRDTGLYPVEYDFYRSPVAHPGTRLLLRGCSPKLSAAVRAGLTHFFFAGNPLIGPELWSARDRSFVIHASGDGRGHIFYRRLKRGEIADIPVVLVIDKKYEAIEKKIAHDRDRNAFGDAVLKLFYARFAKGLTGHRAGQRILVAGARDIWPRGHPLLAEIAATLGTWHGGSWPSADAVAVFGAGYFARSTCGDTAEQLQYDRLERQWTEEGRRGLPQYFGKFGVVNAAQYLGDLRRRASEESRRRHQRPPTEAEDAGLRLLGRIAGELAPELMAIFDRGRTSYTVAETEAVLGELKSGRAYRSREVFLGAEVFVADFAAALAIFLHEHAHIFGYDGSRGFTDALTELLETVVRCRGDFDGYESQWREASRRIARERKKKGVVTDITLEDWLSSQDEAGLRVLLKRVPPTMLRRLRKDQE